MVDQISNPQVGPLGTFVRGRVTLPEGGSVKVFDPNGVEIGYLKYNAGETPFITVPLTTAQQSLEMLTIIVYDNNGVASLPVVVQAPDPFEPVKPTNIVVSSDGKFVTGLTEKNSTVSIFDKNGGEIGSGKSDANGLFTIELNDAYTNGEEFGVKATDNINVESKVTYFNAPDYVKPDAPNATSNPDGTEVEGRGEPGTTVYVKDKNDKIIGSSTVSSDGNFNVPLDRPLQNGEKADVYLVDKGNNPSDSDEVIGQKDTIPPQIDEATFTTDGAEISVKVSDSRNLTAEPNATVNV